MVILGLLAGSPCLQSQVEFDRMRADGRDIRTVKVADGIYQFMTMRDSYVRQLNSVAVITDKDVLVFDTNTRPSSAAIILGRIRSITDKPVRFVVNSHWHPDHWSGNSVYANAFPEAEFIASPQTEEAMRRTGPTWVTRFASELARRRTAYDEEMRSGKRADSAAATPDLLKQDKSDLDEYALFADETAHLRRVFPTMIVADSMTFLHGGRELRFLNVTGDAEGTTVLFLPKEKILITGDAVSYPIPYVQSKVAEQAAWLRRLAALDVDVIIPGHGPAFHDTAFLNLELRLLDAVIAGVRNARASGVQSLDSLQKAVTVDELRESFAHGDPDLESRYRSRVAALVGFLANEAARP
jgi:glyoxylase-like metal-dependent hydrolase (beta-lactamase superfamily II)